MAITKIKPVKVWLKSALDYILDPLKTDEKILVTAFNTTPETAYIDFRHTLAKAIEKGNNRAHHLIQAFKPGETTPEQAHEIGKRFADEVTKGKHEYILTTHIDKGHVHNHIIFCAADFVKYRKYKSNKFTLRDIRKLSDDLCTEFGLSTIPASKNKGKHYSEYAADKYGGGSWKSKIKAAIDRLIPVSKDFEDLLKHLQSEGFEIKRGKYVSVRAPGQERFTRTKTLGFDYTEENLKRRIAGVYVPAEKKYYTYRDFIFDEPDEGFDIFNTGKPITRPLYIRPTPAAKLIVDIQNCVKSQQSAGYERWRKINNLKELAKTLNFLTDNNLLQYPDLEAKTEAVNDDFDKTSESLKAAEKRLADMGRLIKQMENYQRTKAVYDGYKASKKKDAYRKEHEADIIIHEAAARALHRHTDAEGRLPNLASLKSKHENLTNKKNALRAEYNRLRHQVREYAVIKKNVTSIVGEIPAHPKRSKAKRVEL